MSLFEMRQGPRGVVSSGGEHENAVDEFARK